MSNVLNWEDKINTPELEAWLQQFGSKYYLSAEEINELRDVINGLALKNTTLESILNSIYSGDRVIKTGTIVLDDLNIDVAENEFQWIINQQAFLTVEAYHSELTETTDNYFRYDLLVGKSDGTYDIKQGVEGEFSADIPTADEGTIALAVIAIQGASIVNVVPTDLSSLEHRVSVLENINPAPLFGFTGPAYATWSGVGLTYDYNFPSYYIDGVLYPAVSGQITLSAADAVQPRFSTIIADASGVNELVGDAQENPPTPTIDPTTQLFVINVLIKAGETTPAGTSQNIIYNEGTEASALVTTIPGASFTNSVTPYRDTYCIDAPAYAKGGNSNFQFTLAAPFLVTDGTALRLFIKFKGTSAKNERISFQFYKGNFATMASYPVSITRPTSGLSDTKYNIDFGNFTNYQMLVIPFSDFMFSKDSFDRFSIRAEASYSGFKIDYITIISADSGIGGAISSSKAIASVITDFGTYNAPTSEAALRLKGVNGINTRTNSAGQVEIDGQNFVNKETYNWNHITSATGVLTDFTGSGYNMSISFEDAVTEIESLMFNILNKPYPGSLGFIKNGQATDIVIKHQALSLVANRYVFSFPNEQDLVLKPKQILFFKATPDATHSFGYMEAVGVMLDETNLMNLTDDQDVDGLKNFLQPVSGVTATADEHFVPKAQMEEAINDAVIGLLDDRGNYTVVANEFPTTGGSGVAGAIMKGDLWTIAANGTIGSVDVTTGDVIRALVDSPGQTASNWVITENNLGYVAENSANKSNDIESDKASTVKYGNIAAWITWLKNSFISNLPAKATALVDADLILTGDSEDSFKTKTRTFAQLLTTLGTRLLTYFAPKDTQIEVSANTNVLDAWNGQTILFTANCTVTVPASLMSQLMFVGRTLSGVTVTWAITSPFTWETTPTTTTEKKTFSFIRRGSTNTILLDQ